MNKQQTKNRMLQLLVVLTAIGFYSAAQAARVDYKVEIKLNGDQDELEVETKGKCAKKNHKGCIDVAKGTQARFRFKWKGTTTCNRPGGKKWVFGEVFLGGKNSADKPTSWGGFENDAEVRADFNFADEKTGQLNQEEDSDDKDIYINNNNNSHVPYDIWYKVTAVCEDKNGNTVGKSIETDPRIKNGGRS